MANAIDDALRRKLVSTTVEEEGAGEGGELSARACGVGVGEGVALPLGAFDMGAPVPETIMANF